MHSRSSRSPGNHEELSHGRWDARARRVVAAGASVVWALAAGFFARQGFQTGAAGWGLLVSAVVAAAAGALAGAGACWEAALVLQSGTAGATRTGALLAVVSVVGLGVLPRLALAASGLSALDDRRAAGASASRYRVATALAARNTAS